jgi:sulfate adenylyltransferase subunit 1 (EFTu-like GTPase family)
VVQPGGLETRVASVEGPDGPLGEASAPLSVALTLEDELDAGRGALICGRDRPARSSRDIVATVCWMGESAGHAGGRYVLKHTTRSERARLEIVHEALDVATLSTAPKGESVGLNDIARVSIRCAGELVFDAYAANRTTGAFILIDEATNDTVAAGMIADD